ncbi:hypothetical protein H8D91_00810 [archaeon]|nr:hypothetical protein [archaeon]
MANKLALSIIISIILTIILVSTVNVGTSLFLNEPEYEKYCDYNARESPIGTYDNITKELCESNDGTWTPQNIQCIKAPCPQGYCDFYQKCNQEYQNALKPYNQTKFYIFAGIGFLLLLVGLFTKENLIQLTGLATGGILVFEGIVTNLENKLVVFISLLLILSIFGVLAYRVINKSNEDSKKKKSGK